MNFKKFAGIISSRWHGLRKSTRRITSAFGIAFVLLLIFTLLPDQYELSAAITDSLDLVPEKAVLVLHAADPAALATRYDNSDLKQRISNSVAWKNLLASPEATELLSAFYYLETQTGNVITPQDLPSYCGGSSSLAVYPDNTKLAVIRTNMKSRLGVSLLQLYRGEAVQDADMNKIDEETRRQEEALNKQNASQQYRDYGAPVNADRKSTLFSENNITLGNLKITRLKSGTGYLYLTLLGDYFFFSDSLPLLTSSLKLAAGKSSSAMSRLPGISAGRGRLTKQSLLFYIDGRESSLAPVISSVAGADGLVFNLHFPDNELARGDVFAAGKPLAIEGPADTAWQKQMPAGSVFAFTSTTLSPAKLSAAFKANADSERALNASINDFWQKAGIAPDRYFGNKGMVFCFNGLRAEKGHLYPLFSFGFASAQGGDVLLKALFKTGSSVNQSWQNTSYSTWRAGADNWYTPSLLSREGRHFITTDVASMQSLIATQSGNSPRLSSSESYGIDEKFADAPHQLLIDMPLLVDTVRTSLYYSADNSSDFGRKTVDTEIMPLLAAFDDIQSMHIALGLAEQHTGSLRFNPKR